MKRILLICFVTFFGLLSLFNKPAIAVEQVHVEVAMFYGDGCPHCKKAEEFLSEYIEINPDNITVHLYEIYYNRDNASLLQAYVHGEGVVSSGVPLIIIGDDRIVGYQSDETTGATIVSKIDDCRDVGCTLSLNAYEQEYQSSSEILKPNHSNNISKSESDDVEAGYVDFPVIGRVDINSLSLPVLTIVIAFLDGFNPCAMWVLVFLITLLLGLKDPKRRWILGISFILASGLVYFIFLAAWLSVFQFVGYIGIVRTMIGIIAIGSGIWQLKKGIWYEPGCKVVAGEKRQETFSKLKKYALDSRLFIAVIGIVLLAFSVNLVELVCSAGLPAIYTQVLSLSDLQSWEYYGLLVLYVLIFMLDDLFIFFIAMITMQITGISGKYAKYVSIIGGGIILVIGLLLLLKPELLMLG